MGLHRCARARLLAGLALCATSAACGGTRAGTQSARDAMTEGEADAAGEQGIDAGPSAPMDSGSEVPVDADGPSPGPSDMPDAAGQVPGHPALRAGFRAATDFDQAVLAFRG